jgi:hypothetical protein
MRKDLFVLVTLFAAASVGGMCWKPPPYHDVSGTWANASHGSGRGVDIVLSIRAPEALHHKGVPVTGVVCLSDPNKSLSGTYRIEAPGSIYEGTDYGGAHLDVTAVSKDGRTFKLDRAFMNNAARDKLRPGAMDVTGSDGTKLRLEPEDLVRRSDVRCAME